jgi:hypothetical protein
MTAPVEIVGKAARPARLSQNREWFAAGAPAAAVAQANAPDVNASPQYPSLIRIWQRERDAAQLS